MTSEVEAPVVVKNEEECARTGADIQTEKGARTEAGTDPDPWEAFAPIVPKRPGRLSRTTEAVVSAIDRFTHHEWTLAVAGCSLLAIAMTWPVLRDPTSALPDDLVESAPEAWRLAWAGHSLTTDPTGFFSGNVLHGESGITPIAAQLLGYTPFGMIGTGSVAAVVRYNLLFVLAFALAAFGGYALVRQLGGRRLGATIAALAFAFGPWKLGQAAHLDAQSVGGTALALAMLARGHGWSLRHGGRPDRRNAGWVLLGWIIAAWQISLGVDLGLPFAYILATIVLVMVFSWIARRGRPRPRVLVLLADLVGIVLTAASATGIVLLAISASPDTGTQALAASSIPLRGFITAPAQSLLWGGLHDSARDSMTNPATMAMLPGFFLLALALTGLVVSTWRWHHRLLMLMGVGVSGVLAMGTLGPEQGWFGYRSLARSVPGFDVVQSPNRLIIWAVLLLSLLAAGAFDAMSQRVAQVLARLRRIDLVMRRRPVTTTDASTGSVTVRIRGARRRAATRVAVRLLVLLPLVLVAAEALPHYATPAVEPTPAALRAIKAPALILPTGEVEDANVMLWSVDRFPLIANRSEQPTPARLIRARELAKSFPDAESIKAFSDLGVTTVVVLRSPAAKAGYAVGKGEVDEYLLERFNLTVQASDDVLVFTLPPR